MSSFCRQCEYKSDFLLPKKIEEKKSNKNSYSIALIGNPNTGKTTLFNVLTGMRQHTGNWSGKTVLKSEGFYFYKKKRYSITDLPGMYSLLSQSQEEELTRDYLYTEKADVVVLVLDYSRLERNLNLALQVMEITPKVILCLNLKDEAQENGIYIDEKKLSDLLGIPVVSTAANKKEGIEDLHKIIEYAVEDSTLFLKNKLRFDKATEGLLDSISKKLKIQFPKLHNIRWVAQRILQGDLTVIKNNFINTFSKSQDFLEDLVRKAKIELREDFYEKYIEKIYERSSEISEKVVSQNNKKRQIFQQKVDRILTGRFGLLCMMLLFIVVIWTTIVGANYPSQWISTLLLEWVYPNLKDFAASISMPFWLNGLLIDGIYLSVAWVTSVMLPPMAIFFPIFGILEDLGYLPRVAFVLDPLFKKVGAHGKQALTMSMGFGCNAAGVVSTRIIDSPRERIIAILTNNFALCNGRWGTQILMAIIFIGSMVQSKYAGIVSSLSVFGIAFLGIFFTFGVSWILTKTLLKGEVSSFSLELPPYRRPQFLKVIYYSMVDKTLLVLWRALYFAAPAGLLIWGIGNIYVGDLSLAQYLVQSFDATGLFFGLNGVILLTYILSVPANELVIPCILMLTVSVNKITGMGAGDGVLFDLQSTSHINDILTQGGWTIVTGINLMIFSLLHNPCSTTIYTIYQETKSIKWTTLSIVIPIFLGLLVTFIVAQIWG